ncbi:MAG: hypothetical protein Q8O01_04790, partial [Candidatus Omnitrophota bacterium]|nr:hypothetical protein [Candidatus Omnitrophota bacterium]
KLWVLRHCEARSAEAISDEKYKIASLLSVARNDKTQFFHSFRVNTRCWYETSGNWDRLDDIQRSVANLPQDEQILDLQE